MDEYVFNEGKLSYRSMSIMLIIPFLLLLVVPIIIYVMASYSMVSEAPVLISVLMIIIVAMLIGFLFYFYVYKKRDEYGWEIAVMRGVIQFRKQNLIREFSLKDLKNIVVTSFGFGKKYPSLYGSHHPTATCEFNFGEKDFQMRISSAKDYLLCEYLERVLDKLGIKYDKKKTLNIKIKYTIK